MPAPARLSLRATLPAALALYACATLISMAVMSVGAGLLAAALFVAYSGPKGLWRALRDELRANVWSRRYLAVAIAFFLALVLSLVVALLWPAGYGDRHVEVHFLRDIAKGWYLFWPLPLVVGLRRLDQRSRDRVLAAWLCVFGALSFIGIGQFFTGWPRPQAIPGQESHWHVTLFLGHHLSVASILIFPYFATLGLLVARGRQVLPKPLLAAFAIAGTLALFGTYSRMLWLALPVGLALWLVLSLPRRAAVAALALFAVCGLAVSQLEPVQRRMRDAMGVGERQALWEMNREFFYSRPLTGVGWHHNLELAGIYRDAKHAPGFVGHAHNNLVEAAASTGIVGTLAWLAWIALAIALLVGSPHPLAKALLCAWLVFHLNGLTQVNFWEAKVLHQEMWVTAWALLWRKQA